MSTKYIKKANITIGQFLKAHRQGEELSQTAFAKLLGLSKQRVCDLEHDRFNVSIKLAKEIAKKIKVPPEWLVKITLEKQLQDEDVDLKVG